VVIPALERQRLSGEAINPPSGRRFPADMRSSWVDDGPPTPTRSVGPAGTVGPRLVQQAHAGGARRGPQRDFGRDWPEICSRSSDAPTTSGLPDKAGAQLPPRLD